MQTAGGHRSRRHQFAFRTSEAKKAKVAQRPQVQHHAAVHADENFFTRRQQKALREAFEFFDIDNDGRITCAELQKVLRFLGTRVSEAEVRIMIDDVDINRNGTVEFNEFMKMMKFYYTRQAKCQSEEAEMYEAFKAFDHNDDNFIDFIEIKKTMHFLGEDVSDEDVKSMIREADVDKDGRINFEEFKKMMDVMHSKHHGD